MEKLVADTSSINREWGKLIPEDIRPAAGKLRLAALTRLMYQHNLGGPIWLQQFLLVFKITGILSQKRTFPQSEKLIGRQPKNLAIVAKSNSRRFTEREIKNQAIKTPQSYGRNPLIRRGKVGSHRHSPFPPLTSPTLYGDLSLM